MLIPNNRKIALTSFKISHPLIQRLIQRELSHADIFKNCLITF